jgi:hypothetical protein
MLFKRYTRTIVATGVALGAAAATMLALPNSASALVAPTPCLNPLPATPPTDLVTLKGVGVKFGTGG